MRKLRDESTPKGRAIWKAVDQAVERMPQWLRKRFDFPAGRPADESEGQDG